MMGVQSTMMGVQSTLTLNTSEVGMAPESYSWQNVTGFSEIPRLKVFMEIREIDRASKKDITMLSELFQEYAAEVKPDMSASIAYELSELPYFRGFMAFDEGQPVAFCVYYETYSTYRSMNVWNIHDVMVSKSARGLGAGRKLLECVLSKAKNSNVAKVTLEIEVGNKIAKNLYESLGFQDFTVKAPGERHWHVYTEDL